MVFGDAQSSPQDVEIGVPQGSILGPLLFIIYINDLPSASKFFKEILFADDSNFYASAGSKKDLYSQVTLELEKLSKWFVHNRLSLNYSKTEFIDFSRTSRSTDEHPLSLEIDGMVIKQVNECKFLGVHLESSLSWRKHIGNVISKISQTIGIIGRARRFMEPSQLTLLYNTMVLPHLQYCIINWGNFKEDHNLKLRDKLLSLQKCFLRIIHGAHRLSHADPLFAKMGALKIDDLFTQAVRIFAFRWTKNMLPATMATLLQKINHSHHTRGSQSNLRVNCPDLRSIASVAPKPFLFLSVFTFVFSCHVFSLNLN